MTGDPPLDELDRLLIAAALRVYENHLMQLASLTVPGVELADTTIDADQRRCRSLLRRMEVRTVEDVIDAIPDDAARGG